MEFAIAAAVIVFLIIAYFVYRYLKKKKAKKGTDQKEGSLKRIKTKPKKIKKVKNKNVLSLKSSGVNKVDKFLYRKELKVLVLISKILPKGYIAFPKIGVDTVLEPVGGEDLFNLVKNKYLDIVIFDEVTMQPKVAIDVYDGSFGDEQLDIVSPYLINALSLADLPLVSIKVKTSYTQEELQKPIYEALGINDEGEQDKDRDKEIEKERYKDKKNEEISNNEGE